MRAGDYLVATLAGLFLAYMVATPLARFVNKSFTDAAQRLEEMPQ